MGLQTFSVVRTALLAAVLITAGVATGCGSSVYHKSAAALPGDLNDRLALRVREARSAADAAMAALEKPGALSRLRADLVDAAAWEYSRRVASVQDVMRRLPEADLEAQQVLAGLQRAEQELTAVAERLAAGESDDAAPVVAPATSALASAIESSDQFIAGRANAAMLPAKAGEKGR